MIYYLSLGITFFNKRIEGSALNIFYPMSIGIEK